MVLRRGRRGSPGRRQAGRAAGDVDMGGMDQLPARDPESG